VHAKYVREVFDTPHINSLLCRSSTISYQAKKIITIVVYYYPCIVEFLMYEQYCAVTLVYFYFLILWFLVGGMHVSDMSHNLLTEISSL
jgi:hypothetical protein